MKIITTSELKKLEKDILVFIDDFCEKNGIVYFLSYGTLIGAVRHQGFIPWDDDIDIMMPRPDYEKFLKTFPEHPYFKIRSNENCSNYPFAYATVNDTRTIKNEFKLRKKVTTVLSVNVDVFPIDGLPDTEKESLHFYKHIKMYKNYQECATKKFGKGLSLKSTILKNVGIAVFRVFEFFGLSSIYQRVHEYSIFAQTYSYEKSKYVGVNTCNVCGIGERNIKDNYFPVRKVKFEGKEFNCPNNYDIFLTQIYGDYMKLPPMEKRQTHHTSDCYWRTK